MDYGKTRRYWVVVKTTLERFNTVLVGQYTSNKAACIQAAVEILESIAFYPSMADLALERRIVDLDISSTNVDCINDLFFQCREMLYEVQRRLEELLGGSLPTN